MYIHHTNILRNSPPVAMVSQTLRNNALSDITSINSNMYKFMMYIYYIVGKFDRENVW